MDDLKELAGWLLGGLMGLLTWMGKRQIKRIDRLEEGAILRPEFQATLDKIEETQEKNIVRLESGRAEFYREVRDSLSRLHDRVDGLYRK